MHIRDFWLKHNTLFTATASKSIEIVERDIKGEVARKLIHHIPQPPPYQIVFDPALAHADQSQKLNLSTPTGSSFTLNRGRRSRGEGGRDWSLTPSPSFWVEATQGCIQSFSSSTWNPSSPASSSARHRLVLALGHCNRWSFSSTKNQNLVYPSSNE